MKNLKLSDVDNLVDKYIIHQNTEAIIKTGDVLKLKLDIIKLINSQIKDNPVPSLDESKIKQAFKKEFYNRHYVEIHSGDYKRIVKIILDLQNGVETDKEQPNEKEIKAMQNFLLCRASEVDASILENFLSKFNADVFS